MPEVRSSRAVEHRGTAEAPCFRGAVLGVKEEGEEQKRQHVCGQNQEQRPAATTGLAETQTKKYFGCIHGEKEEQSGDVPEFN